jgi:hypothetical protein
VIFLHAQTEEAAKIVMMGAAAHGTLARALVRQLAAYGLTLLLRAAEHNKHILLFADGADMILTLLIAIIALMAHAIGKAKLLV